MVNRARGEIAVASTRITVTMPSELIEKLRQLVGARQLSHFIAEATRRAIEEVETKQLREELASGYQANAALDREMAEDWRPLEEEVWDRWRSSND